MVYQVSCHGGYLIPSAHHSYLSCRHGMTEMNEYMNIPGNEWGAKGFVDPGLFDTRLSERGLAQVCA